MDKLLRRGMQWHRDKLPEAAAEVVQIIAGNQAIESVEAVPGRRDFVEFSADQTVGTEESYEWIVAEPRLVFNGVKTEPQEGWLIKWRGPDGRTRVYRVGREPGTRPFDVLDPLGLTYRIHTRLVAIEGQPV